LKTSLKTLDEFYKAVDGLIDRLNANQQTDEAAKLDDLLHHTAWTTGSELLGELQIALKDMKGKYSEEITKEINECLNFTIHIEGFLGWDNLDLYLIFP
jgi:hypothetical protein